VSRAKRSILPQLRVKRADVDLFRELALAAKMGEGGRVGPVSWAQRAPRPPCAIAHKLSCCGALEVWGEGGVSGACAPRRLPQVRTRRAARPGAGKAQELNVKARTRKLAYKGVVFVAFERAGKRSAN
jgi:hypothetical protein